MNCGEKLNKFLEGYRVPDPMQPPPGKPYDPQIVALHQYLQTKNGLLSDEVILDFGSGLGIVASAMEAIWPEAGNMPWYYAVDRTAVLNGLALSPALHNHSRKIDSDKFFNKRLDFGSAGIKVVVIRNVFHELDICVTALLLIRLRSILQPNTELFIQDMVNLPRGERARVGWHPDLLVNVLQCAGFKCGQPVILPSYDGTKCFNIVAHQVSESRPALNTVEHAVISERSKQRERIIDNLQDLSERCDEATTPEYVVLQAEEAAISTQLQQYSYVVRSRNKGLTQPSLAGVPLVSLQLTKLDYAEEISVNHMYRSGLVAVFSSKNQIDFPTLLRNSRHRAFFMGYSQRSLFQNEETKDEILTALRNRVEFKVLLVDSLSDAAKARAKSLAYANYEDLVSDIQYTVDAYKSFVANNDFTFQGDIPGYLRIIDTIPPCSYFIIDDLCFISLYSTRLSGGSGPCIVLKNNPAELNAYFSVLLQEFQLAWEGAKNV